MVFISELWRDNNVIYNFIVALQSPIAFQKGQSNPFGSVDSPNGSVNSKSSCSVKKEPKSQSLNTGKATGLLGGFKKKNLGKRSKSKPEASV